MNPLESFSRLVLYHCALVTAPGKAMQAFLTKGEPGTYLALTRSLYSEPPVGGLTGDAWQCHLLWRILTDENPFSVAAAAGRLTPEIVETAAFDLRLLQSLYTLTSQSCRRTLGNQGLPPWPVWPETAAKSPAAPAFRAMAARLASASDWGSMAEPLAEFYRKAGAGLTGTCWYLKWDHKNLQGIDEPNTFNLDDLVGIDEAKATVVRNTEQFLRGRGANNMLLYGNRGTGKSSMVRGLASHYGAEGLRLVEVGRNAISTIPELFRALKQYPQSFVLFLDDLSFDEDDADFKAFKSMVEGALEQRPANVVLYATSNRRHLVPERWTDRHSPETAEVHGQDAMEEKLSLADRFGITVLFPTPDQAQFLRIVDHLARQRRLPVRSEDLREQALRWVLWQNPRSGRSARQFIDDLAGRLEV